MSLKEMRREYTRAKLDEREVERDPIRQFGKWFAQALSAQVLDPNAMALATCDQHARPSARMVLLKGVSQRGFSFFTDYGSKKGRELFDNPQAALLFFWPELERQVRIEGAVKRLSSVESTDYFRSRPRGSQLAASVSRQSGPLESRAELEEACAALEAELAGQEVPVPERWGGFLVKPETVEFWQGRPSRLHDRIVYRRAKGKWVISRLFP